jgi:hypothetical protein
MASRRYAVPAARCYKIEGATKMAIDVLLVEDHSVVRQSIRAILERGDEFRVLGEVENGAERH